MVRYEDSMLRNITKKYIHIHFNVNILLTGDIINGELVDR